MISIAADDVPSVRQKELGVLRLDLKILSGRPEVVQDQEAVFIREIVKDILGILAEPVADDVEVGGAMQAKIRFQPRTCNALSRIVHAPASAARRDGYTVDTNRKIRRQ